MERDADSLWLSRFVTSATSPPRQSLKGDHERGESERRRHPAAGADRGPGHTNSFHLKSTIQERASSSCSRLLTLAGNSTARAGVVRFGEKGFLWIELEARGKPAHGAHVHLGINAIDRLRAALDALAGVTRDGRSRAGRGDSCDCGGAAGIGATQWGRRVANADESHG
jgi:hypothetical protein